MTGHSLAVRQPTASADRLSESHPERPDAALTIINNQESSQRPALALRMQNGIAYNALTDSSEADSARCYFVVSLFRLFRAFCASLDVMVNAGLPNAAQLFAALM
jgi:hypothetical protein